MRMSTRFGFISMLALCISASGFLTAKARASAAFLEIVPVRASGVEGVDWDLGPGTHEITLSAGGQMVELQVLINAFDTQPVAGYELTIDCGSLDGSTGTATVIDTDCTIGEGTFGSDFCLGVDESEPTYILAAAPDTIAACQTVVLCPSGDPGEFACGAIALLGDSGPDNGGSYYAATFALDVPGDVSGTINFDLNDDPNRTYLRDAMVQPILLQGVIAAQITVPVGACCGASGEPLDCGNAFTVAECDAAGGVLIPATACAGVEGCEAGLDAACPSCIDSAECDDANECTTDTCGNDDCCVNIDGTPAGTCCNPSNGDLTPIDDANECTIDECLPDGTVTHTPDDGAACDDGDACTENDICVADACSGSAVAQSPLVTGVGSKALSITAQPPGAPDEIALLVTSPDWPCVSKYVNADGELQDTPVFQSVATWGTIIAIGLDIVPESTYNVQAECGAFLSAAASGSTNMYADVDNSGGVNLGDVQLVVFGFQLNFMFNTLEELDIWPCLPNKLINFEDIQHSVLEFQQVPYETFCPVPCP